MKKGILWGLAGLVAAGGCIGTIAYTSEQVDRAVYAAVDQFNQQSQYSALSLAVSRSKGLFSSTYYFTLNLSGFGDSEMPQQINLETEYNHGLMSTHGRTLLARDKVYNILAPYTVTENQELLEITTGWRFNPFSSQQTMDTHIQTAALNIPIGNKQDKLEIGALDIDMDIAGRDFILEGSWSGMRMANTLSNFQMDAVSISQTGQLDGDLLTASMLEQYDSELVFRKILVEQKSGTVALDNTRLKMSQHPDQTKERLQIGMVYSIDNLRIDNPTQQLAKNLHDLKLDLSVNTDYAATLTFAQQLQDIQRNTPEQLENPQMILGLLSAITEKGINLQLNTLELAQQDLQAFANADVQVAGFSMDEAFMDQDALKQKVSLTANLTVPEALLQEAPDPSLQQNVAGLIDAGIVKREADNLVIDLNMTHGQLQVNGQPMPL